jgi:arylsulfatase A-like enzyme
MRILGALVGLGLFLPQLFALPPQSRRPNIIFILADDLGYGDLGCYGQQKFGTPHLDRMAAQGIRFTQYYSGSTVCAPSRCSLMTGYHTGHAYIRGNAEIPLRAEDVTVARVLKDAGYKTGLSGKWGLGVMGTSGHPNRQGFDDFFGYLDHLHAHHHYTDHLFRNEERVPMDPQKDYSHDHFTAFALDFVEKHKAEPFFLYLAYTVPHADMVAPEDSMKEFRGKFPEKPFVNGQGDAPGAKGYRSQPAPNAALAAMVTRMDRDIGRLFGRLAELGIDEDTVVFFTSDNGPHREGGRDPAFFNSSGGLRGIKRDLYEGGIRMPMIVRWPGHVKPGGVSDAVWANWDVLPTLAEIAGARAPAGLDGISFLPACLGKDQKAHEFLYWEFFERGFDQAIRMGDWKAVRNGLGGPLELYDLRADPAETQDVASVHPEVVDRLESALKTARSESDRWIPKKGKR